MVNYAVEDWTTGPASLLTVAAAIETKLETIDNAKVIRMYGIIPTQGAKAFYGYIIYDT